LSSNSQGWIGCDFDGTLVQQDAISQFDPSHIGEPVELMVNRVRAWLELGKDIRIFTARVSGNSLGASIARKEITEWCKEHLGKELPVTCIKEKDLIVLYDDKAVQVEPNTGKLITSATPHGLHDLHEAYVFMEGKAHCSDHFYHMNGCTSCGSHANFQEQYESKIQKVSNSRIGLHPLEITPGTPGPKLQLVRQQTTRKIFIFLQNAQADVVEAIQKKAKELNKVSDEEKRDLFLVAALAAISWADFIKEVTVDLMEAMKFGITNGLEQLAVVKTTEDIDKIASDYADRRSSEMVGMKWQDGKLVNFPGARYNIAETIKDDVSDVLDQTLHNKSLDKLESNIAEAGIFGRKKAELIGKTEIAMAQSKGNLDIWKAAKLVKTVGIVVSENHDVEDLCDEHVALGAIPISKAPSLPLHPNCSCSMVAIELVRQ
jgi:hypothetical protein